MFTSILKIIELSNSNLKVFKTDNHKVVNISNNKTHKTIVNLSNKLKNKKSEDLTFIKAIKEPICLIANTKKTFN